MLYAFFFFFNLLYDANGSSTCPIFVIYRSEGPARRSPSRLWLWRLVTFPLSWNCCAHSFSQCLVVVLCVCILFVHVENCGWQIRAAVTPEKRIKKSCEVSRTARTDFGEPECMFVRTQCNKSADTLQPLPQSTKWDWKNLMEIRPQMCTKWRFCTSSGKVSVFVLSCFSAFNRWTWRLFCSEQKKKRLPNHYSWEW